MICSVSGLEPSDLSTDPLALIDQADALLPDFPIAAGMLARAALESYIRLLCDFHDRKPRRRRRPTDFSVADALQCLTPQPLDRAAAEEAARLFATASRIVHCEPGTDVAIDTLLEGVRRFVESDWKGGGVS